MSKLIAKPPVVQKNVWISLDEIEHIWENKETGEFFFVDETEDFNGPFRSKEEAQHQFNLYCEYVLAPRGE